jgi:hypothetical protein
MRVNTHLRGSKDGFHAHIMHAVSSSAASAAERGRQWLVSRSSAGSCCYTPLPHQARRPLRPAATGDGAPLMRPSAPSLCRRCHRKASSGAARGEQLHRNGAAWPAAHCCTCRAQRGLGKNGREWAGRGRHPGASLHRGAPEATAAIGNSDAARRLRVLPPCADAPKYANLTARYTEKMTDEISRTR